MAARRAAAQSAAELLSSGVNSGRLRVSRVCAPSIEVLAHGGQHDAEEPAFPARHAGLVETAIEFLTFDPKPSSS